MKLLDRFLNRNTTEHNLIEKSSDFDAFRFDPGWFQKALDHVQPSDLKSNTAVYSCVNILSQEVASLHLNHWRVNREDRSRTLVTNSQAMRVLRKPNQYQTSSDFWLYMMRALLLRGQAYGVCTRNRKFEIDAIHPMPPDSSAPLVAETGDIFYQIGGFGDGLFKPENVIPSINVFHPRINCNRHPLIGETPITALSFSANTGSAIQRSIARFFSNMSRPSGVLTTPKPLTKKQIDELRDQWNSVTAGKSIGATPVLHSDLKWEQVSMTATDAEVIKSYELSVHDIAMAYRIPLFMLGDLSKASFRNVETLMRIFYTSSLRFYLEHLENHLNILFELDGTNEYLEFDIEGGLLRGDLESRVNALTKGVQGGVYVPNEARRMLELPPVKGGDEAYLQRQMVPISVIAELLKAELAGKEKENALLSKDGNKDEASDEETSEEDAEEEVRALIERIKGFMQ
jgi:HK97 family phage portal protein